MERTTGFISGRITYIQDGIPVHLHIAQWSDGDQSELTIELWDAETCETYWKGGLPDLADIIETHLERDRIPEPVTMATVGPLRDNGNPYETGVPY